MIQTRSNYIKNNQGYNYHPKHVNTSQGVADINIPPTFKNNNQYNRCTSGIHEYKESYKKKYLIAKTKVLKCIHCEFITKA